MSVLEPGTEFGGYRIERLLGTGGFCSVYLAEDLRPALRRKVALKVLNPTLSADEKNRERFQRESLLAVELDEHPNIVGVLDAGEHEGQLFIAQRYIDGHDLGKEIEDHGPLTPERAVEILTEIADALDTAHRAGLVHRDVKPRNILLRERDGRAFLADFGLTKRTASSDSLTGAGEFLGTFAYAAPEQLGGQPVDGRADIYALGCVLFESLTGEMPFSGDIHSMITAHLTKPAPRVSASRADLPAAIDAVVDKAMAKEPGDRYQTGHDFADACRRALLGSGLPPPVVAPPPPPVAPTATTTPPPGAPPPPGATATSTTSAPTAAAAASSVPPAPVAAATSVPPAAVPPAAGAGPATSPTPPGRSSRIPVLVGAAVVVVLAVVAGVLLLGGGDDGGGGGGEGGDDEEAAAQELEDRQDAAEEAFAELPAAIRAACELQDIQPDTNDNVVAAVDCEPEEGADTLAFVVYDEDDDVDQAFGDLQDRAGQELDTTADCVTARYAVHSWTTADDPDGVAGQVACYLDGDGEAAIVWTDDERRLVGDARRDDQSDATLYQWWAEQVGRLDPADTAPFPNTDESELLAHIPTAIRDTCVRADLRPSETASVQCTPRRGAATVFYSLYPSSAAASGQYEELLANFTVQRDTGRVNRCPFEGSLTIDDLERGRVFCDQRPEGQEVLVWVNTPTRILAEATIAPGATVRQFWNWWTTAGPLLT